MQDLKQLMAQTRSCRRFDASQPVTRATLVELIELSRLAGSARNLQPLKYLLANTPEITEKIFPHLGWAGYLPDWPGPEETERPTAYITCLLDNKLCDNGDVDLGIASQNILLGATSLGLAGCRIGSISAKLHSELGLPEHFKIMLVIALGVPKEEIILEDLPEDGSIKYYRDEMGKHHVPKRPLQSIIVKND
jgi:nitroreductase